MACTGCQVAGCGGTSCTGGCYLSCQNIPCSGNCSTSCSADNLCGGDCSSDCGWNNGCGSGCKFDGCTNSCTGCKGCTGVCSRDCSSDCGKNGCTSCVGCTGCTGDCKGACDKGCSSQSFDDLYNNLKIRDVIFLQDINNLIECFQNEASRMNNLSIESTKIEDLIILKEMYNKLLKDGALMGYAKETDPNALILTDHFQDLIDFIKTLYDLPRVQ